MDNSIVPMPLRVATAFFGFSAVGALGVSWFWALATSIGLFRQAKAAERAAREAIPPRINELP